jgi:hypothetical protein
LATGNYTQNFDITVYNQSGIVEIPQVSGLIVYPNPTNHLLQITSPNLQNNTKYSIYSLSGQMMMQGKLQGETTTINVKFLPKGMYYLKVGNEVVKVIKEL